MQLALPILPPEPLQPVPEADAVLVLAKAIRCGKGEGMTREAEAYLAGVSATFLVSRLALTGWVFARRSVG